LAICLNLRSEVVLYQINSSENKKIKITEMLKFGEKNHKEFINTIRISENGRIYTHSDSDIINVFNLKGELIQKFHTGELLITDFEINENYLTTVSKVSGLRIFSLDEKGIKKYKDVKGYNSQVQSSTMNNENIIISSSNIGELKVVPIETKMDVNQTDILKNLKSQDFEKLLKKEIKYFSKIIHQNKVLALKTDLNDILILNFGNLSIIQFISMPYEDDFHVFKISTDSKFLICGGFDGLIKIFKIESNFKKN
jgi:WD40 repeat protein